MTAARPLALTLLLTFALTACGGADAVATVQVLTASPDTEPTEAAASPLPPAPLPTETALPTPQPAHPAITESRVIDLEWPSAVRMGSSDVIVLTLDVDQAGRVLPTALAPGTQQETTPVDIPDLYETHNVLAVARLDAAGFAAEPVGEVAAPLLRGEKVTFRWSITPRSAGMHKSVIFLRLRFVPRAGGDILDREIWARTLEIEGATVFGLSGPAAALAGGLGSAIGTVLGLPFIDGLLRELWQRIKSKARRKTQR